MTVAASAVVLGFLLATAYGAGFHVIVGGPARHILMYLLAAWVGFTVGHFVGDLFNIETFKLGALHLMAASAGAWLSLIGIRWFNSLGREQRRAD